MSDQPKIKVSEQAEQEALFQFLRTMEGRHPLLRFVFHVPNQANGGGAKVRLSGCGNRMVPVEAFTNARMGVKKGAWDIWAPFRNRAPIWEYPAGIFVGCAIEMKARGGRLSPDQEEWAAFLCAEGWSCTVCYDWTSAAQLLIRWVGGDPNEIEGL
jgi:hypothetical protein